MTKEEKLISRTNEAIAELVYPKWELLKAYNYYSGKRDAEQFRYLEENFGIGNPTSVEFTPLIKKHIDALIGEYLGTPILPKVSCKDSATISNIAREKQLKVNKEVYTFLLKKLKNALLLFIDGKDTTDKNIEELLNKLVEDVNNNFVSEYEIAALNVIQYIMQSRNTDMITKLRHLILDLLVTGYTFYRVKPSTNQTNIDIEVLDPLNVFPDRNLSSPYVKDSHRIVVRYWLTQQLIVNKYGKDLSKEDLAAIKAEWKDTMTDYSSYYIRNIEHNGVPATDGLLAGQEVVPGYPTSNLYTKFHKLIPVYEVEWIETDKNFIMQRYETVRIGEEIYILKGKNKDVIRTHDNPSYCSLSVNGVYYVNRTTEPYSLVLACKSLQDKYDLLNYYRDNLIANSGTVGDWIDMSLIPTNLGVNWPERILKWLAYKKGGLGLLDTSLEGRLASGLAPMNTIFNGFDDTVKGQAILAIQLAIQQIEQTMSSITGVFQERLNGIELRDAVTNVKQSVTNSFIITKLYYQQMDLVTCEMLVDSLNTAKTVYKNGLSGTIILGEKYLKIFTALPEHFTMSDWDIHIVTSTDVMLDLQTLKLIIPEFIKSNSLAPDIIFDAMTSKSLSDVKFKVKKAMAKLKEENNLILQLLQQGLQLLQQLQEALKQLQLALQLILQLDQLKMLLEQTRLLMENKVEWYKAQTERTWREKDMENDEKRIQIELELLHDGNPYNDTIRLY